MQKLADITFQNNTFHVIGDLDFSNVMSVYQKSLSNLMKCPEAIFNFSQLTSSDSSCLALIMEWMKFAASERKPIRFTHLSAELMSIAKAAGMDKLIAKNE